MSKISKKIVYIILALAFIGFLDSVYLTAVHYAGSELNCGYFGSCNEVTTSEYSIIFGIPTALLGALYYLTVLILGLIHVDTKKLLPLKLITPIVTFGFLFSFWLVYLQIVIIEQICLYCMASAGTTTILFALGLYMFLKLRKEKREINNSDQDRNNTQ